MDPAKPKRRFQIHLTTMVVLMFASGGLIWLNVTPHMGWPGEDFGWPMPVIHRDSLEVPLVAYPSLLNWLVDIAVGVLYTGVIMYLSEFIEYLEDQPKTEMHKP